MAEQVMAEQVMAEQVMAEQVMAERRMAGGWGRRLLAALGACVLVVVAPQSAWAATDGGRVLAGGADVLGPLLSPVAGSLKVALLGVGGVAIGIYVTVWALQKAWGLFKGLVDDPMVRGMTWNYDGKHPGGAMNERDSGDGRDWSHESAEYDAEMNATGPDHLDFAERAEDYDNAAEAYGEAAAAADRATALEQDAAAISYLDRYR